MGYPTKITDMFEIADIYNAIQFPTKRQFGEAYLESHVFDEEKSVKWNREEVQRRNMEVTEKFKAAREEYYKQLAEFWLDVDKYIANEFKLSLETATTLRNTIWTGDTVAYNIDEFQNFLSDFFDCLARIEDEWRK